MVIRMKKINLLILSIFISLTYAEESKKVFQIQKLHVNANEDAYVASFKASTNLFVLEEIKIKKPKQRNLKKLRFINDDDEYAIKVLDKNGVELIAIGIGNPFFCNLRAYWV
tara:strand:- start:15 stop:350 length:336 start_codon:yes stop_codon:yes gene_type:complete